MEPQSTSSVDEISPSSNSHCEDFVSSGAILLFHPPRGAVASYAGYDVFVEGVVEKESATASGAIPYDLSRKVTNDRPVFFKLHLLF